MDIFERSTGFERSFWDMAYGSGRSDGSLDDGGGQ
jgi:hypothetical protein